MSPSPAAPIRLGTAVEDARAPGVRVVIDARALQDPERTPITAAYLDGLLGALDDSPGAGESFSLLLSSDRDDPTRRYPNLDVVGRRLLPPTRLLGPAGMTVDPILLRGASLGAGWRAERAGATGSVYHAPSGALPLGSRIPVVAVLLDLAPWELRDAFARGRAARFGRRLRVRLLRSAAIVVVPSTAAGRAARQLLRIRRERLRVIPLAPRPAFRPAAADDPGGSAGGGSASARERDRLGLAPRYLVYAGRYDARQDLRTLLDALARLAASGSPQPAQPRGGGPAAPSAPGIPWPPRVCLVDASPEDRAALSRAASREGVADLLAYAPRLPPDRLAALVAGARALVLPVRSDAAGLPAIEALAAGVPVVASSVGALPEIVGSAGILVDPGAPDRLAAALRTVWLDDQMHDRLVAAALERARSPRSWADVARETRSIWADVARPAPLL